MYKYCSIKIDYSMYVQVLYYKDSDYSMYVQVLFYNLKDWLQYPRPQDKKNRIRYSKQLRHSLSTLHETISQFK